MITVTSTHDFSTAMTRLGTPLTQDDRRVGIELRLPATASLLEGLAAEVAA